MVDAFKPSLSHFNIKEYQDAPVLLKAEDMKSCADSKMILCSSQSVRFIKVNKDREVHGRNVIVCCLEETDFKQTFKAMTLNAKHNKPVGSATILSITAVKEHWSKAIDIELRSG